jgi:hypothetical protein
MGKNFLIKTSMGKPPNEMGNCPFASPLVAPLQKCFTSGKELFLRINIWKNFSDFSPV